MPNDELKDRINRLEWTVERQENRMSMGAESFADVRQALADNRETIHSLNRQVEAVSGPRPVDWKWIAGFGFTILCVVVSAIWAFAKYPDADDFAKAQSVNVEAHRALDGELGKLKASQTNIATEQRLIQQALGTQEKSLKTIDEKLDKLLLPRGSRR